MIHVYVDTDFDTSGEESWFVESVLNGEALGCLPSFPSWNLPPLYQSGVRFQYDPDHGTGRESFKLPWQTYADGWGDCANLALWLILEINQHRWKPVLDSRGRLRSIRYTRRPATAHIAWDGDDMHAMVRLPNGKIEDPARKLGMPT